MSKKSRKRNKKILAAIGIGLGAAALASRKKKADLAGTEDNKSGSTKITGGTNFNDYDAGTKKPVAKPDSKMPDNLSKNTGKDNKIAPRNEKSVRVKTNTNKVYTDATGGESTAKVGNKKSVFKGADGYLRQGENGVPMTPGRFGTFKASKDIAKGAKPANLGLKSGGRAGYKSGGSSVKKSMGKALRGGGKVMR